ASRCPCAVWVSRIRRRWVRRRAWPSRISIYWCGRPAPSPLRRQARALRSDSMRSGRAWSTLKDRAHETSIDEDRGCDDVAGLARFTMWIPRRCRGGCGSAERHVRRQDRVERHTAGGRRACVAGGARGGKGPPEVSTMTARRPNLSPGYATGSEITAARSKVL